MRKRFVRNWGRLGMRYKLSEIMDLIGGGTPKTSNPDYWNGDIPWLSVKDFGNDNRYVYETEKHITKLGLMNSSTKLLDKGDIIISARGTVGEIATIPYPMAFNQSCYGLRANKEIVDEDFLYYLIKYNIRLLKKNTHGSVFDTITRSTFDEIEVDVPDLDVQKKIGYLLSELDKKIELNNKINNNLEQQIEAILLSFIENTNSNNVKLGDYLYIKGRIGWKGLKKDEYLEHSDFRIINGESLTKAGIDWSKAGYISQSRYDESPEIMLKKGDILLSKDGTIGKIGYIDSLSAPTTVASGIFVIRNIQPEIISTTFIYFLLKSRLFTDFITARTEGSVIPHLYQKDFMQFEFPLPSKDEMASFEKLTAPMFSFIVSNLNENDRLTRLRDSLLPRLMSGELDVSNISL